MTDKEKMCDRRYIRAAAEEDRGRAVVVYSGRQQRMLT